jgi:shikimate kinase
MGAGKTTVGQLLARRLNWRFLDVDVEIEAAAQASIADLFLKHGEPWFRQVEYDSICRLAASEHVVLALGGGAIEDERTRLLLLRTEETQLVHLHASLGTVLVRCKGTDELRPVLRDRANLEARYERRLPLYRQAHLTIPVDTLLPEAVVESILEQIATASQI